MSNGRRFSIAIAVVAIAAAAITTAVYGLGRGAPGEDGVPAGALAAPGKAPISISGCKLSKVDVITYETTQSTTSASFVPVTGMTKSVKTGKGCLIVNFSDYPFAGVAGSLIDLTVTVDGVTGHPSYTQFSGDDDENADGKWGRSHSAQFVFSVTKKTHTVQAQWLSFFGDTVFLHQPVMVMYHS